MELINVNVVVTIHLKQNGVLMIYEAFSSQPGEHDQNDFVLNFKGVYYTLKGKKKLFSSLEIILNKIFKQLTCVKYVSLRI